MPRATRTSQAAIASAVEPDESLRAFYNSSAAAAASSAAPPPSSSSTSNYAHNHINDPLWTGRRSSNRRTTAAGLGTSTTSNVTDLSVSSASASVNSPIQSSHGGSEASSYTTHGVPGVIDEGDEDGQESESEEEEDVVVVTRASASNGRLLRRPRRRRPPSPTSEEEEAQAQMNEDDNNNNNNNDGNYFNGVYIDPERSNTQTISNFSSRLLDESEEDELMNATNNGGNGTTYNSALNGDVDDLADATNEEVEARAMEELQWDEIGKDKELYAVDLERWKVAAENAGKFKEPGTAEYKSLQAIQAKLLTAVQELDSTEWMYPEPLPFTSYLPEPSSTIAHKLPTSLPFATSSSIHSQSSKNGGTDDAAWSDRAFNPLSTFTPLAPVGQATYPDTYRVQRALGALPARHHYEAASREEGGRRRRRRSTGFPNNSLNERYNVGHDGNGNNSNNNSNQGIGYHGNAIPRHKPDFTWLDAEAHNILGDQEKSFAAKAKFPWATALSSSSSANTRNANAANGVGDETDINGRDGSMVRTGTMSLTREVGVIRLQ